MQEKIKVLFVDDERHILTALRALFRNQYEVLTANSGNEALDIVRRENVHVIVSDQRMPKMLGSQLLSQVKEISPQTMRLLLTGYADMSSIMKSINDGEVFRFITKPWDNDDIQAIVSNAAEIAVRRETESSESQPMAMAPAATAIALTEQYPALLALDPSKDTWDTLNDLFHGQRVLLPAETINDAIGLIQEHDVGVIITDVQAADEDTTVFIKLLKQQYPLIAVIILTAAADSEMAIKLINQGQIYRYLSKPVSRAVLRLSIEQGLQQYQRNQAKPWLLDRYKPDPLPATESPSLASRIRNSLRLLRFRFRK